MNYKLEQNVKVIVTHELDKTLTELLKESNYKKPMIAIDQFMLNNAGIQILFKTLEDNKIDYYIYDKIIPDPPATIIDEAAHLFKENQCDSIIGIGGGSAIDTARGINIVRTFGGSIIDYVTAKEITAKCKGLIAVPTTSGTGSELSNALVVSDPITHEKLAVLSNYAVSEYAVLNPELVVSLPPNMTAATGLDAFSHAAEGYTSQLSSPITDAICEKIMYLIVKYLPKAVANGDDIEARERMMVAAALGGWMLNNAGTHVGHSQAHIIGANHRIPHGMACAYALPGTLKYTAPVAPKKIKEIGLILGAEFPADATNLEIGDITAKQFKHFRDHILSFDSIDALSITKEDILALSEDVAKERFASNAQMDITVDLAKKLLNYFG